MVAFHSDFKAQKNFQILVSILLSYCNIFLHLLFLQTSLSQGYSMQQPQQRLQQPHSQASFPQRYTSISRRQTRISTWQTCPQESFIISMPQESFQDSSKFQTYPEVPQQPHQQSLLPLYITSQPYMSEQQQRGLMLQHQLPQPGLYYHDSNSGKKPPSIFSNYYQPPTWNRVINHYPPATLNDDGRSALRNPMTQKFVDTQTELQPPTDAASSQNMIDRDFKSISDYEKDYSDETDDSESDYYDSSATQYDDSVSDIDVWLNTTNRDSFNTIQCYPSYSQGDLENNPGGFVFNYFKDQNLEYTCKETYLTKIIGLNPNLPINCFSVWEMQKTIRASQRIWDSFKAYRHKYLFRKLNDLCCVKGISHTIKLRFKHMFVYDNYNYSVSDDPYSLPPHVQSIVDFDQECKTLNERKIESIVTTDNLFIFHINARGLKKNFENFKYLIDHSHPDVVCVTETNNPDPKNVCLLHYSYKFAHSTKKGRGCKGGVMIYVKNNLNYKHVMENIELPNSETIWIELESRCDLGLPNIIIGVVYRHPKPNKISNIDAFQRSLTSFFQYNIGEEKAVYILGDINIDLLDHSHKFIKYCENLADHKFKLLITKPTRVKNQAATLIDHIYARDIETAESGIIEFDNENSSSSLRVFDHFPIYCKIFRDKREFCKDKISPICRLGLPMGFGSKDWS